MKLSGDFLASFFPQLFQTFDEVQQLLKNMAAHPNECTRHHAFCL